MSDSTFVGNLNDLINSVGVNLFEDEIDGVIFQTNEFLTEGWERRLQSRHGRAPLNS